MRAQLWPTLIGSVSLVAVTSCGRHEAPAGPYTQTPAATTASEPTVELSEQQLGSIKLEAAAVSSFSAEKETVGTVDFDNTIYSDPKLSTQVFPPAAGQIGKIFVDLGERVRRDQPLYSVDTDTGTVIVRSPLSGQVSSVNAASGLPVKPDVAPAPVAIARVSGKWVLANVIESDSPLYRVGQTVEAFVAARPERVFSGRISKVYPSVDPTNHRITVRAEISDPANELLSGMLATLRVRIGPAVEGPGVPGSAVVREGDGTMTLWTTSDRRHFTQRAVKTGLRTGNRVQIVEGLRIGELVVTEGGVFLSNMLGSAAPE